MKKFVSLASILFALNLIFETCKAQSTPPTQFDCTGKPKFQDYCIKTLKYEKAFDGKCNLIKENINPKLVEIIKFINSSDPDLLLDEFLGNYLFKDITSHFRVKYSKNTSYITKLNGSFSCFFIVLINLKFKLFLNST